MSGRLRRRALVAAVALLAVGCRGDGDITPDQRGSPADVVACQVTDIGGLDNPFNAVVWGGLLRARQDDGAQIYLLESHQRADYEPNLRAMVQRECDLIVTVGFRLSDATRAAAQANPDVNFTIVDFAYTPPLDNVLGQSFATDEAAFLAGYLAAGMTRSGAVGAFGSVNIPTVTVYMDGFARGVEHYNERKDATVRMLGWDPEAQNGLFTSEIDDEAGATILAERLIEDGADVLFPVSGPGLSEAAQVADDVGGVHLVGAETDACLGSRDLCHLVLTSVLANADRSVLQAVRAVAGDDFEGGTYVGTLENGGVGLAPYRDPGPAIPDELAGEVEELREALLDGRVHIPGS
ncbi:MAG: BMP family ABC transporter substrate-binding protein [Actinomycetota bacterium]|nr:BMP family ABC transporter substrate-binding protein [Actinomycetota bacterium]